MMTTFLLPGLMLLTLAVAVSESVAADGSTERNDGPRLEDREAQPYVAVRETVAMKDLPNRLPALWDEVAAWLDAKQLRPSGPTLLRYVVVDMDKGLELEVGFPVASPLPGDGRVFAGEVPAGRYAALVHRGDHRGLVAANAALQAWAMEQGLTWKRDGDVWNGRFELYPVDPGDTPDPTKWVTEVIYQVNE